MYVDVIGAFILGLGIPLAYHELRRHTSKLSIIRSQGGHMLDHIRTWFSSAARASDLSKDLPSTDDQAPTDPVKHSRTILVLDMQCKVCFSVIDCACSMCKNNYFKFHRAGEVCEPHVLQVLDPDNLPVFDIIFNINPETGLLDI